MDVLLFENMRLRRVVKVGFFCGVGRDCRSEESRTSPLVCGASSEDGGAALVELLRELTDADEGVGTGEVWALGVALGRALACLEASVGDSAAVAAILQADTGDMRPSSRGITSMGLAKMGKMRVHARAGARRDGLESRPKSQGGESLRK